MLRRRLTILAQAAPPANQKHSRQRPAMVLAAVKGYAAAG